MGWRKVNTPPGMKRVEDSFSIIHLGSFELVLFMNQGSEILKMTLNFFYNLKASSFSLVVCLPCLSFRNCVFMGPDLAVKVGI